MTHTQLTPRSNQAVPRVSKQFLPEMAAGLTHAKSTVHIGDGFKFLNDYKNSFDVIITDSSDPEGPAESLFQKPYFQLLHDALREGGVITTQGCRSQFYQRKSRRRVSMMDRGDTVTSSSSLFHLGKRYLSSMAAIGLCCPIPCS